MRILKTRDASQVFIYVCRGTHSQNSVTERILKSPCKVTL